MTAATAALIYALIRAGDHGWATGTAALLAVPAVLCAGFVARQCLAASPLMNVRLLTRRPVTTAPC